MSRSAQEQAKVQGTGLRIWGLVYRVRVFNF